MRKTVIIIMVLSIASKIVGFIRETVLAYFYGASNISDAYLISLTMPETIYAFIGIGLSTCFIPIYSNLEKDRGSDSSAKYMNNVINTLIVLCLLIILLVWMFTPQIIRIFASGFSGETFSLAVHFTRITVIGLCFRGILYIFKGFLQINNNFIVPELVGVLFSLLMILSIILSFEYSIVILAVGFVVAKMAELVFAVPFVYRKKYRYEPILDLKDKNLRRMLYLALPAILGISVDQINTLVDKTMASMISIGGISALNYAFRLDLFIQGIFVMSISTVLYPSISKMSAEGNMKGFKETIAAAIRSINMLIIPATVGAMLFAEPIVMLLFGRGAFDAQAVSMTSDALFFYSIGMLGFGLREILSRAFYSLQDTRTPMINASIAMLINITLNLILSKYMGISGLALATSISAMVCSTLLMISLRRKIGCFGIMKISTSLLKILFAAIVMGITARLAFNCLTNVFSQNMSLIITVLVGMITYFAVAYAIKIEDFHYLLLQLKRKLRKSSMNI